MHNVNSSRNNECFSELPDIYKILKRYRYKFIKKKLFIIAFYFYLSTFED